MYGVKSDSDSGVVGERGAEAADVEGVVIEGGDMSLLGQAYLSRLNSVTIAGDSMTLR